LSAQSGGRRPRDPAGRRQAIIDAATRVIAEAGLAGLTHRRVAELADIPLGSTTYYFKDLDDLRQAALADAAHGSVEGLDQWALALAEADDLPGTLAALVADYLSESDRYRAVNELYTAAAHHRELRPLARVWDEGLRKLLEPHCGRSAAEAVTVFIDGALVHALITDAPLDSARLTDAIARLMSRR
jgi:TetR/AcrR family transcriptional regulator, regulator of biofilm formation and stress response